MCSGNEALWDEISGGWRRNAASVSSGILRQSGGQSENTTVYSRYPSNSVTLSGGENLLTLVGWRQPTAPTANTVQGYII